MKSSVKILIGLVVFTLGALSIVYGTRVWDVMRVKFQKVEVSDDIRVKGPTGPPSVQGPTGPPPQ